MAKQLLFVNKNLINWQRQPLKIGTGLLVAVVNFLVSCLHKRIKSLTGGNNTITRQVIKQGAGLGKK
jgi:hypothetical protein